MESHVRVPIVCRISLHGKREIKRKSLFSEIGNTRYRFALSPNVSLIRLSASWIRSRILIPFLRAKTPGFFTFPAMITLFLKKIVYLKNITISPFSSLKVLFSKIFSWWECHIKVEYILFIKFSFGKRNDAVNMTLSKYALNWIPPAIYSRSLSVSSGSIHRLQPDDIPSKRRRFPMVLTNTTSPSAGWHLLTCLLWVHSRRNPLSKWFYYFAAHLSIGENRLYSAASEVQARKEVDMDEIAYPPGFFTSPTQTLYRSQFTNRYIQPRICIGRHCAIPNKKKKAAWAAALSMLHRHSWAGTGCIWNNNVSFSRNDNWEKSCVSPQISPAVHRRAQYIIRWGRHIQRGSNEDFGYWNKL